MQKTSDLLITLPFIALAGLFFWSILRLFHRRYIKTYRKEIWGYCGSMGLNCNLIMVPTEENWKTSPFKQPPKFSVSFISLNFMGFPMRFTDIHHLIVYTQTSRYKEKIVWVEIKTTLFVKPKLQFYP